MEVVGFLQELGQCAPLGTIDDKHMKEGQELVCCLVVDVVQVEWLVGTVDMQVVVVGGRKAVVVVDSMLMVVVVDMKGVVVGTLAVDRWCEVNFEIEGQVLTDVVHIVVRSFEDGLMVQLVECWFVEKVSEIGCWKCRHSFS